MLKSAMKIISNYVFSEKKTFIKMDQYEKC